MLRVWKRNSTVEGANKDLEELKCDLLKCGHSKKSLEELHQKLRNKILGAAKGSVKSNQDVLVAVVNYFSEIDQLKTLINQIKPDVSKLIGKDTQILVSARRGSSIGSQVVKNRLLCETTIPVMSSQKCGAKACRTCPLVGKKGDTIEINGKSVSVKKNLNCKSRNVIYLAQCKLCDHTESDNTYTGQTSQPFHKRINGHRSCFAFKDGQPDPAVAEKSALSLHNINEHINDFSLDNFKFVLHDQVRPRDLNRRESRHIGELRTNVMGLNRMFVQN